MTASTLKINGSIGTEPVAGNPSGIFALIAPLQIQESLVRKLETEILLDADPAVPVDFGSLTEANVLFLKGTGGKFKATLTSTDGASQVVPVDDTLMLTVRKVPITAISLTRETGVEVSVSLFLGEYA